jgi:hypothetical protein
METTAPDEFEMQFSMDFDYGTELIPTEGVYLGTTSATGGFWNVDAWDTFVWSGVQSGEVSANIGGIGKNVGVVIYSKSASINAYTIQSMFWHYSQHRLER